MRRNSLTIRHLLRQKVRRNYCSVSPESAESANAIVNEPIKLVPKYIHDHIFGIPPLDYVEDKGASDVLRRLEIPPFQSERDPFEHLHKVAVKQFRPYKQLLEDAEVIIENLPERPKNWSFTTGWTRYNCDGSTEAVKAPLENVIFFDVEVCVTDGQLPTLAVALTPKSWYSWCSDRLINQTEKRSAIVGGDLIPLEVEKNTPRIVIGHNVGYDRKRVMEQYFIEETMTRFWDTMSMNIAICGMTDQQRTVYEKKDSDLSKLWINEWRQRTCRNSLTDVFAKHCGHNSAMRVDKSIHQSLFVEESIDNIRMNFQKLVEYCASDVEETARIFSALYPKFKERFPSPITSMGMLIMANVYLPITRNWTLFFEKCEAEASNVNNVATQSLAKIASNLVNELLPNEKYANDPWMWVSDWRRMKTNAEIPYWFLSLFRSKELLLKDVEELRNGDLKLRSHDIPRIFGICYGPYPLFRKMDLGWGFLVPDENIPAAEYEETTLRKLGKSRLPVRQIYDLVSENRRNGFPEVPISARPDGHVGSLKFYQLPHPIKEGSNVGTPLAKDFHYLFAEKVFRPTRFVDEMDYFLKTGQQTRFWSNYRDRYNEQLAVWEDENQTLGAIAPAIAPAGTVTRRAVEKLWLTSANAKEGMIGSELKSMVQCPPGWNFVGADVDSQEQWIAAVFGDSLSGSGHAGSTPFSRMQLAGSKSAGTDLHSVVANSVGISRDAAKQLNYARLYGSGQTHAVEFLTQRGLSQSNAMEISNRLFETTKGRKKSYLELNTLMIKYFEFFIQKVWNGPHSHLFIRNRYFLPSGAEMTASFEEWLRKNIHSQTNGQTIDQKDFLKTIYQNWPNLQTLFNDGFESDTFNFLELSARDIQPKTPILHCRITRSLEPISSNIPGADEFFQTYKRSIINWVISDEDSSDFQHVQSSAVDFLHMILVCMKWLCDEFQIQSRFVISIHDEIRFLVRHEDRYRAALALNFCNMIVRSAISQKMGIRELPMSVAFFSQVDVDTILRKEVDLSCQMPDGSPVSNGESLSMGEIMELTNGSLKKSNEQ